MGQYYKIKVESKIYLKKYLSQISCVIISSKLKLYWFKINLSSGFTSIECLNIFNPF